MAYLSRQEMFDRVAVHLIKQGHQCADKFGCCYRDDRGRKCAAGIFMPDDVWSPEINQKAAVDLNPTKYFPCIDPENTNFLWKLQGLHDDDTCWETGGFDVRELRAFANHYGLNTDALDAVTK